MKSKGRPGRRPSPTGALRSVTLIGLLLASLCGCSSEPARTAPSPRSAPASRAPEGPSPLGLLQAALSRVYWPLEDNVRNVTFQFAFKDLGRGEAFWEAPERLRVRAVPGSPLNDLILRHPEIVLDAFREERKGFQVLLWNYDLGEPRRSGDGWKIPVTPKGNSADRATMESYSINGQGLVTELVVRDREGNTARTRIGYRAFRDRWVQERTETEAAGKSVVLRKEFQELDGRCLPVKWYRSEDGGAEVLVGEFSGFHVNEGIPASAWEG